MGRAVFNYGSEKPVGSLQGALPLKPFTSKSWLHSTDFVLCGWLLDFGLWSISLPISFFLPSYVFSPQIRLQTPLQNIPNSILFE